jgi:carbamoyltransferase
MGLRRAQFYGVRERKFEERNDRRCTMSEAGRNLFGIDKLNVVRAEIPAVTHVDYSARMQTIDQETSPRFHALLSAFKARTCCDVPANTTFDVGREPIAYAPEEEFQYFNSADMDACVCGNDFLEKFAENEAFAKQNRKLLAFD